MGHMIHRGVSTPHDQKVFLATPAYSGVEAGYAFALFESSRALEAAGIGAELALFANDCHVDDSRNRLVRQFLMTDCTDLVFLDSDLRWEPKDLVALCQADGDVVGATYPLKQEQEGFPVMLLEEPRAMTDLVEVQALPTGFLRIKRHVLEKLAAKAKQYYGKADNHTSTPLIFERTLVDGVRWGGDYTFCRKWRELGGKIHLMPDPVFEHIGSRTWTGCYKHHVLKEQSDAIAAALYLVERGEQTVTAMLDMWKEWGNPWSAEADLLMAAADLGRGKTVVETGCGLSTLVLAAAGAKVIALEHDGKYAEELWAKLERYCPQHTDNVRILVCPIEDGWYAADMPECDLLIVDGPPRKLGDRTKVPLDKVNGPILWDDWAPNDLPLDWHKLTERVSIGHRTASH